MAERSFFLTFDGAPNPPGTDAVLDALDRHRVRATFFMEGRRLESEAECARRVLKAGHDVGNHSYNHPEFDSLSIDSCLEEVRKTDAIVYQELGIKLRLFRPPAGKLTQEVEEVFLGLGYTIVLWSYSIRDWEGPDARSVAERVLSQIRDNAIVVFHDRIPWVADTLDIIIPEIRKSGYRLKRISEFGDSGVLR